MKLFYLNNVVSFFRNALLYLISFTPSYISTSDVMQGILQYISTTTTPSDHEVEPLGDALDGTEEGEEEADEAEDPVEDLEDNVEEKYHSSINKMLRLFANWRSLPLTLNPSTWNGPSQEGLFKEKVQCAKNDPNRC